MCPSCKTETWIPKNLWEAACCSPAIKFYCPYGHELHYKTDPRIEMRRREEEAKKNEDEVKDQSQPKVEGNVIAFPGRQE